MSRTYKKSVIVNTSYKCHIFYDNKSILKKFIKRLYKRCSRRQFKYWYDFEAEEYDYFNPKSKNIKGFDIWKWT